MTEARQEIDAILEDFDGCLDAGDLDGARRALEKASASAGTDDSDVRLAQAELALETDGPEVALALLEALTRDHPNDADALYALGSLLEEVGDAGATERFVQVLRLDLDGDRVPIDHRLLARIEEVARAVVDHLPPEIGERLRNVPIVLEERPTLDIVRQGFDPRAFGLFEGNEDGEGNPVPTRIVLYTRCLIECFGDEDEFEEQVEITVLHEIGHFLHLDEDDVERLGLA